MTAEPLHSVDDEYRSWIDHESARGERPRRLRRALARLGRVSRVGVARLTRPARLLPGLAALGCAFAGSLLLWGLGVALLVAAGLFLLADAQTPRP